MTALYDGVDMAKVMYGQNAIHVPAFFFVQNQGGGMVSFIGGSMTDPNLMHPLRYGSDRSHQFVIGEIIARPHVVVGTDALRGEGLNGVMLSGADLDEMLAVGVGEMVVGTEARVRSIAEQSRRGAK